MLKLYLCIFYFMYCQPLPFHNIHWAYSRLYKTTSFALLFYLKAHAKVLACHYFLQAEFCSSQHELTCGPGFPRMPCNPGGPWTPCPMQTQHVTTKTDCQTEFRNWKKKQNCNLFCENPDIRHACSAQYFSRDTAPVVSRFC